MGKKVSTLVYTWLWYWGCEVRQMKRTCQNIRTVCELFVKSVN
nr:MAG TPA: hypothetical protein [Caudoviricetes sp.]